MNSQDAFAAGMMQCQVIPFLRKQSAGKNIDNIYGEYTRGLIT